MPKTPSVTWVTVLNTVLRQVEPPAKPTPLKVLPEASTIWISRPSGARPLMASVEAKFTQSDALPEKEPICERLWKAAEGCTMVEEALFAS